MNLYPIAIICISVSFTDRPSSCNVRNQDIKIRSGNFSSQRKRLVRSALSESAISTGRTYTIKEMIQICSSRGLEMVLKYFEVYEAMTLMDDVDYKDGTSSYDRKKKMKKEITDEIFFF
jgi:hypothetical protein